MPLVQPTSSAPPVEKPTVVEVAAPEYKGVTVDTRVTPLPEIVTYIEGSTWTVEYLSQVLDSDNQVAGLKKGLDAPYQQYLQIKGMELKVTSPLQTTQDSTTNAMLVIGTANVYPFLIPNVGDLFLADIGDGKEGIFQITNVERKSIFKEASHTIEYQLLLYMNADNRALLNTKIVKSVQFVKDFLLHGQDPLLIPETFAAMQSLQEYYEEIVARYFKSFVSSDFRTLILPNQDHVTYDHFLVTAIMACFTPEDYHEVRYVRRLNCDDDLVMKSTTIWDALIEQDRGLIKYCSRLYGAASTKQFEFNPVLDGIYYSGIDYVVYPKDPEINVDYQIVNRKKELAPFDFKEIDSSLKNVETPDLTKLTSFSNKSLVKPILSDESYVLSSAFYSNKREEMSILETLVMDYLERKSLDTEALVMLCQSQHTWTNLQKFYFVPILLILVRAAIRNI